MSSSPNFSNEEDKPQPDPVNEPLPNDPYQRGVEAADAGTTDQFATLKMDTLNSEKQPDLQPKYASADGSADSNHSTSQAPAEESIFHNRNFMLLWISQALTQTAQNTLNLALVTYVNQLSGGSATQTAIATVAFVLPGVFFSALAGAFVDRVDKRTILIVTNVLRAIIIPWLVFMANIPIALALPLIFLITFLFSSFSQFFAPAEGALIPFLVKENQFTRANSLFQITLFASQFIGFSILAPLLPRWIGSQNLFWVIAAIFGFCILLTWWLPDKVEHDHRAMIAKEEARNLVSDLWSEIREGWRFIRSKPPVWMAIIYLSMVQSVLFAMTAIGIPYVSKQSGLGQSESDIIFVLAPLSIGLGVGVWLVNKLVTPQNRSKLLVWATIAMGINMIMVGMVKPIADLWVLIFSPGVPLGGPGIPFMLIIFSIPFGLQIAFLNVPALTIMQEKSPKDIIGRVFSAYFTFANLVSIFPILFGGALSDLIGFVPTFFFFGLLILGIAYYAYRSLPKVTA